MKNIVPKILYGGLILLGSFTLSYAAFPVANETKTEQVASTVTPAGQISQVSAEESQPASAAAAPKPAQHKAPAGGGKSQIIALLLVLLVGGLGIHRFYLGYTWQGVVQLLTGGGCGVWALIDLIRIITGDLQPKDGSYDKTL